MTGSDAQIQYHYYPRDHANPVVIYVTFIKLDDGSHKAINSLVATLTDTFRVVTRWRPCPVIILLSSQYSVSTTLLIIRSLGVP